MKLAYFTKLSILSLLTFSCGSAQPTNDVANSEAAVTGVHSGYYTIRMDDRHCASPICGGFFVKSVNSDTTQCFDGTTKAECYVGALDLAKLQLTEAQITEIEDQVSPFVLRGIIKARDFEGPVLGVLETYEAWRGHSNATPSGTFFAVKDNHVRCITFPCPSYTSYELNRGTEPLDIHNVDVSRVTSETNDGSDASTQLSQAQGLLVAGEYGVITGPAGQGTALNASEYYIPLQTAGQACNSDESCGAEAYCDFGFGACNAINSNGVCRVKPQACPYNYNPVCACDGNTYPNECSAHTAGALLSHPGTCASTPETP